MGKMKELAMEKKMDEHNEEEAQFYFTLIDFENLLHKHGAHFVIKHMRNDSFMKLAEWFSRVNDHDEAVIPALLKRKPDDA